MFSIGGTVLAAIKSLQQNARAKRKGFQPDLRKKLRRKEADPLQLELARNKRETDLNQSNRIRIIIFVVIVALIVLPALLSRLGYWG